MDIFIFILLGSLWLIAAGMQRAAEVTRPWQQTEGRQLGQFMRKVESLKHALKLLQCLLAVATLAQLVQVLATLSWQPVILWTVVVAILLAIIIEQRAVQQRIVTFTAKISTKYGQYLKFVPASLAAIEPTAAKFFKERPVFESRDELLNLVQHHQRVHGVLHASQQQKMQQLLKVAEVTVQSKFTPLKDATLVRAEDTLGPLLLSELHDSPYGSFAVYDKRRANIVGIIDQPAAVSHAGKAPEASKIMDERVVYLPHDASLLQAIQTFIETSSPISVIIDDDNKPIGVLYIQDILRELFENVAE